MLFRQITHDDLGCASYLIGDGEAGVAAVVDPRFEVDRYLEIARYGGVRIEHVFETHTHADHVSGHGRLAAATGAAIHVHREAGAGFDHLPFGDGDEWELGTLRIRALHTPGHRPEHSAFVLSDAARGDEPWAVLTGDSLFVNDVARPDLAIEPAAGARGIFRSLHERLLALPDTVEVWPGHLGGSMCGGPGMDLKPSSTIGFERRHNPALAIAGEDAFVQEALAGLGPQPPNFEAIVELNRGPLLTDGVELRPLAPRQVAQRAAEALVVDVRSDEQFDDAHIPGAVSISLGRMGFGSRLAWLADHGQDVIFAARDDAEGRAAGRLAVAVGVRRLAGFLHGGMTAWRVEGLRVASTRRIDAAALPAAAGELQILDVRERAEWESGHIPGSLHTPWHDIDALPDGLDAARPVAVACTSGQRAAVAASLLQRHGAHDVIHVVGGGVDDVIARGASA